MPKNMQMNWEVAITSTSSPHLHLHITIGISSFNGRDNQNESQKGKIIAVTDLLDYAYINMVCRRRKGSYGVQMHRLEKESGNISHSKHQSLETM